jgi:hypothetical protein
MGEINVRNINFGGLADSNFLGAEGSVSELYQLDIHSDPGIIKLNQKLTALDLSGLATPIADIAACAAFIPDTIYRDAGHTSFTSGWYIVFNNVGKAWAVTRNNTTLAIDGIMYLGQISPGGNTVAVNGVCYMDHYLYYFSDFVYIGRLDTNSYADLPAMWTARNDTFDSSLSSASERPTLIVNDTLYFGNQRYVGTITVAGVVAATALDIDMDMRVTTLNQYNTDIIIGAKYGPSSSLNFSKVYRWNTTAASFSFDDYVNEIGVRAAIPLDNEYLFSAGKKGNLYSFNGNQLEKLKKIKGSWGVSDETFILNAYCVFDQYGKPLFGMTNRMGAAINAGLWSFARANRNYPYVLAFENAISSGNLGNLVEVTAMAGVGDQFIVVWRDKTSGTYVYGIDQYDTSAKVTSGYFTTRSIVPNRTQINNYAEIYVPYKSLPTGTSIKIYAEKNHGTMTEITDKVTDTDRMLVHTKVAVGDAAAMRIKVELLSSANLTPETEGLIVKVM